MKRLLLLCGVVLVLTALSVGLLDAQSDDVEQWYFGVSVEEEVGALSAFNLHGDQRVLIDGGVNVGFSVRLGPQLALAVLEVDGERGIYRLTPDEATPLIPTFEMDEALIPVIYLAYHHPYLVGTPSGGAESPFLLFDLESNTIDRLSGLGWSYAGVEPKFSADGRVLRYLTWDPTEYDSYFDALWTLWERDLETGQERALHQLADVFIGAHSDRYGERWLHSQKDSETDIRTYTFYYADGSSEVLAEIHEEDDQPTTKYLLYDDRLLEYATPCELNCQMVFTPLEGGEPVILNLPVITYDSFLPFSWVDAEHLAIRLDEEVWLLGSDDTFTLLGFTTTSIFGGFRFSPDGRFVVVADARNHPEHYRVWDLHTQSVVVEEEIQPMIAVGFREGGTLVINTPPARHNTALYRYRDGITFQLPNSDQGSYVAVSPGGNVLYHQQEATEERPAGIYLYDPEAETLTFLAELSPIALYQYGT